jgi:hypothetical protein
LRRVCLYSRSYLSSQATIQNFAGQSFPQPFLQTGNVATHYMAHRRVGLGNLGRSKRIAKMGLLMCQRGDYRLDAPRADAALPQLELQPVCSPQQSGSDAPACMTGPVVASRRLTPLTSPHGRLQKRPAVPRKMAPDLIRV